MWCRVSLKIYYYVDIYKSKVLHAILFGTVARYLEGHYETFVRRDCKVKLEKIDRANIMLTENSKVEKDYITSVQTNKFQQVDISPEECKESVEFFTSLKKKQKME